MEKIKIILNDGVEKEVDSIFYLYNSKYYLIYTEKELDEKGYVILYLVQVGKEIKNTPNGPLDTGYMVGVEISDSIEWENVQKSITKIVEDTKNNTKSSEIQYLPINMLKPIKIISKEKFRLMKNIITDDFKLQLDLVEDTSSNSQSNDSLNSSEESINTADATQPLENNTNENTVIIDYRAKFFEEQQKNEELQQELNILKEKLENIKQLIEN